MCNLLAAPILPAPLIFPSKFNHDAMSVLSGEREHRLIAFLNPAAVLPFYKTVRRQNGTYFAKTILRSSADFQHGAVHGGTLGGTGSIPCRDAAGFFGNPWCAGGLVDKVKARLCAKTSGTACNSHGNTGRVIYAVPLATVYNPLKISTAFCADR